MTVCGGLAILSPPHFASGSWNALACNAAAWVVFCCGVAFRFWPTLYIGGRKLHTLANEGPYSITRNPLYLGTFLIWASAAIGLQSVTLGVGVLLGVLWYALFTIPAEEKQLAATLGEPYREYCRQVPRFVPRWSQFRTPSSIEVTTRGLKLELHRALRWIWLPIVVQMLNQLRIASWWPQGWLWP